MDMAPAGRWGGVVLLLALGGATACGDGAPTEPAPELPDASRGLAAFQRACNACHVQSDGLDLALFGFSRADIERRAAPHVDADDAAAIAAYVTSIGPAPLDPDHRIFQPGGVQEAVDDEAFWVSVFGATGIPGDFTPADLRAVDPRTLPAPFLLPAWSDEEGERDWLPERPLPTALLEAEDGRVEAALDTYHEAPSDATLLGAIRAFREVSVAPGRVCEGGTLSVDRPLDCFEARRWMAALAALHLLREGRDDPPDPVLQLWWEVGEVGVDVRFHEGGFAGLDPRSFEEITLSWLYLAYQFRPDVSPSPGGYIGIFSSLEAPRFATFTQLRRMVHEGPMEAELPWKPFEDGLNAVIRAPEPLLDEVLLWVAGYLADRLDGGMELDGPARETARERWEDVPVWYAVQGPEWSEAPSEVRAAWEAVRGRLAP